MADECCPAATSRAALYFSAICLVRSARQRNALPTLCERDLFDARGADIQHSDVLADRKHPARQSQLSSGV